MRYWAAAAAVLGAALCFSPARADQSFAPTAITSDQVLARARAARGDLKPGAYHRISRSAGENGTLSQIDEYENGDDFIETIHTGEFTSAYGSRAGVDWTQNANGTVTLVSGFHERENPYTATIRAPEQAKDAIKVLGTTLSEPTAIVVELAPRKGLVQRRYYDAKSYLLRRVETTNYDGATSMYEYDDFRTAYGLTYPQSIDFSDGHPENSEHAQVLSFETSPAAKSKVAIPKNRPVFDLQGRPAAHIPAEFTPHGIIVRVTIGGRGLDFELDSGASGTVIDAEVARELGLSRSNVRKGSFSGDFTEAQSRVDAMSLGDLQARNVAIDTIPFARMVGDRKVVGLLGGDFFASGRIAVDFKTETLSLLAPSALAPPAPWVPLSVQLDDLVPRLHAKFNGKDGDFIVDLGADLSMLYSHYFAQFRPNKIGDVAGQVEGVAGAAVDYHEYTFSRFELGDLAFENAHAIVASGRRFEDLGYDGLLGRDLLSSFNLIFDYPNQKLYIEPPP